METCKLVGKGISIIYMQLSYQEERRWACFSKKNLSFKKRTSEFHKSFS